MPDVQWIFSRLNARAALDILFVAVIVYWLLGVAQGTRAAQLIRGLVILTLGIWGASRIFELTAIGWLLSRIWPALLVAIPVIFQPELRRVLEQIGHTGSWLRQPFPAGREVNMEQTVDEICRAAAQLSRNRYGALMVLERDTGLQDYADRGVALDATVTRQLLVNIFFPNSPLHDGAVIMRQDRILAASVVLHLTENVSADGQIGTRHRAAIGVTEESDALAVVVSEETGNISLAYSGRLIRNLDQERLRRALRQLLKLDRPAGRARRVARARRIIRPGRSSASRDGLKSPTPNSMEKKSPVARTSELVD
jgi:uncharacterized protein (TIGR00159 family)